MDIYRFIREKIQEKSVFIEIGCHMGLDTKKFVEITGCQNIHCFEPDDRNTKVMIEMNLPVILNKCVISNIDGSVEFYKSSGSPWPPTGISILDNNDWSSSGSIKIPKLHKTVVPWCKFDEVVEVKSIRMDSYCKNNNIVFIDFVWMDVQGAEIEVLSSFGEYLNKTKFIYTEYSREELYENSADLKNILDLLGNSWEIVHDFGTDVLVKNKLFD